MARKLLLLTLLLTVATGLMHASAINGSVPFSGLGASQDKADLSLSTMLWDTNSITSGVGLGDFFLIPINTDFGPFSLNLLTIGGGGGFLITNATYGTFTASFGQIITRSKDFLDVYLEGMYAPNPGMPGKDPTETSLRLAFTQSGQSLSVSGTMNSPPAVIPEPGTLSLLGSGVLSLAAVLRRKLKVS